MICPDCGAGMVGITYPDGLEEESLKLFRLTKERMEQLENEFVKIIVNTEVNQY